MQRNLLIRVKLSSGTRSILNFLKRLRAREQAFPGCEWLSGTIRAGSRGPRFGDKAVKSSPFWIGGTDLGLAAECLAIASGWSESTGACTSRITLQKRWVFQEAG